MLSTATFHGNTRYLILRAPAGKGERGTAVLGAWKMPYSCFPSDKVSYCMDCLVCVQGPQSAVCPQVGPRLAGSGEEVAGGRDGRSWACGGRRCANACVCAVDFLAGEEKMTILGLYVLSLLGVGGFLCLFIPHSFPSFVL